MKVGCDFASEMTANRPKLIPTSWKLSLLVNLHAYSYEISNISDATLYITGLERWALKYSKSYTMLGEIKCIEKTTAAFITKKKKKKTR
jgi:hypothetical protein